MEIVYTFSFGSDLTIMRSELFTWESDKLRANAIGTRVNSATGYREFVYRFVEETTKGTIFNPRD
jgi:aspartate ammonia-lyase